MSLSEICYHIVTDHSRKQNCLQSISVQPLRHPFDRVRFQNRTMYIKLQGASGAPADPLLVCLQSIAHWCLGHHSEYCVSLQRSVLETVLEVPLDFALLGIIIVIIFCTRRHCPKVSILFTWAQKTICVSWQGGRPLVGGFL